MARGGSESARASAQQSRQTSGTGGLDQLTQREVTDIAERVVKQKLGEQSVSMEKMQVLLGERGDKTGAALTRGDMALGLERLPTVSAAPTADQHNELVNAFNKLIVALADLSRK